MVKLQLIAAMEFTRNSLHPVLYFRDRGAATPVPASPIQFDEFSLDCDRYELLRSGRPIKLEKIPMELLILLASKDGNLVTRQEIIERLWGKDVFVDTEHGINTAIRKIRLALRDDPERPRFVQTVTGKGYRFVAETRNGNHTPPISVREPFPLGRVAVVEPRAAAPRRFWRLGALTAAFVVAAGVAVLAAAWLRERAFPKQQIGSIHSIAVLPLANLSGDASQDYYADGMTDEIITALAQNHLLRVVSRTSAMQFKGANKPLPDIAKSLGVDGILEGSVNRSSNSVHVNLQLIYAPTDTHVWARSYDRDLSAAVFLPGELAQTIATAAKVSSGPAKPLRRVDPAAHDAYLHGRYLWFEENPDRAQQYFEQAIKIQPDYAAAWSGLADSYTVRGMWTLPPREVIAKAKAAALKAVELDGELPEAHNALAAIYLFGDWDPKRADEESQRTIALDPNFAEAYHLRAYILATVNRMNEALNEQKKGADMDPFARPWAMGLALLRARQFDAAAKELQLRAEGEPQNNSTHFILAEVYWEKRMGQEYAQELEKAFTAMNDLPSAIAVRRAFEKGGSGAVAEWDLNKSKAQARKGYYSPWWLAGTCARLRRREETLDLLEAAYREHSLRLIFLQVEPVFDFLHAEPRYRALVSKMGLPPAWDNSSAVSASIAN